MLVIEVDGPAAGLDQQQEQIVEFCRDAGAREVLQAASPPRSASCCGSAASWPSGRSAG